jgi:hypothetical protein
MRSDLNLIVTVYLGLKNGAGVMAAGVGISIEISD